MSIRRRSRVLRSHRRPTAPPSPPSGADSARGWLTVARDLLVIGLVVSFFVEPDWMGGRLRMAGLSEMSAFGFVIAVRQEASEALVEVAEVERVAALADSARREITGMLDTRGRTIPQDLRVPFQNAASALDTTSTTARAVRDSVQTRLVRIRALSASAVGERDEE